MTEERTTETVTADGTHHTHTTVRTDEPRSRGSGMWVLLVIVLIAALAGFYLLSSQSGAEIAKDNAVANAANEVGDAANQVGEAASQAGDAVEDAVDGQ